MNGRDPFTEIEELIISDLLKTFSETVLDHWIHPRNFHPMEDADRSVQLSGMCGDTIGIFIKIEDDRIAAISFVTDGCGTAVACASALTCLAQGLTVADAARLTGDDVVAYLGGLPEEKHETANLVANALKVALEPAPLTMPQGNEHP
ncbi:MAG: iron-sulfur cluster assembly scaffold protein [Desulfomonile tiedjei]|nr:iron-sulfur cluster assembly scaffold protein [Desulfomonile tiedjei]